MSGGRASFIARPGAATQLQYKYSNQEGQWVDGVYRIALKPAGTFDGHAGASHSGTFALDSVGAIFSLLSRSRPHGRSWRIKRLQTG